MNQSHTTKSKATRSKKYNGDAFRHILTMDSYMRFAETTWMKRIHEEKHSANLKWSKLMLT